MKKSQNVMIKIVLLNCEWEMVSILEILQNEKVNLKTANLKIKNN